MTTKIKYTFINGVVLEVEAEDCLAAYIPMDRLWEEKSNRKHRRYNFNLDSMKYETVCNPVEKPRKASYYS